MKTFDIVLILGYFRPLTYFLSIIKYLHLEHKIGVYIVNIPKDQYKKNIKSQALFVKTCFEFGATILENEKIKTNLLLIPQNIYTKNAQNDIINNIVAKKKIGILGFAWAGVRKHDQFVSIFKLKKFFCIEKRFTKFLLKNRNAKTYDKKIIIETGLPFQKYPIFDNLSFDYFLVMPTAFSFPHESDKWEFLCNLQEFFKKISIQETIVHKPHNGLDVDQFATEKYMKLIKIILHIPFSLQILKKSIGIFPSFIDVILSKLYTAYLYTNVLKRTIPLDDMSIYSSFGVEAFYPNVKKGVIGGLSNTIWGALYHKLPFYNAIDLSKQDRYSSGKLYVKKDTSNLIDLNLKYFNVPFCKNTLKFDKKNFFIIHDKTRNADIIKIIKREL